MAQAPSAEVSYGGQAVIDGVMIRSPRFVAVACRHPHPDGRPGDAGTAIDIWTEPVRSLFVRWPLLRKIPLLRGFIALFEMLALGLRSLERSANIQAAFLKLVALALASLPAEEPSEPTAGESSGTLHGPLMLSAIIGALGLGVALFVLLPNWLAELLGRWFGLPEHGLLLNLIEGLIRLLLFVGYILAIGRMRDIQRVFQYHGAEHKVVNGFEAGLELESEAMLGQSVIHPRCGTNFAFIVIVMSLVVFAFLPWTQSLWPRLGLRLLFLPLVAGISFELIRFVGTRRHIAWLQTVIVPGLALQKLTTREPEPHMLEVALASLRAVVDAERTGALTCRLQAGLEPIGG